MALERGLLGLHAAGDVRAEAVATGSLATMLWVRSDAKALEIIARAAALLDDEPPSARLFRRLGAEPALSQTLRLLESRELSRT